MSPFLQSQVKSVILYFRLSEDKIRGFSQLKYCIGILVLGDDRESHILVVDWVLSSTQ